VEPGAIFVHDDYLAGRAQVQAELVTHGWIRADVHGDIAVDRDALTAEIHITIVPGVRYRFGTFTVTGTSTLPDSTARARVPWREGDVFDPAQLLKLQQRLLRLGLYGQVRLTYDPDPQQPERLNVTATLSDGVTHDLRLGGGIRLSGIDTSNGLAMRLDPHLRASYTLNRVPDPLSTLTLDLRPGVAVFVNEDGTTAFSGSVSATLGRQDIFFPYLHGAVTVAYDADVLEAYQATGPRVRVGFDQTLFDERLRLAVAWQLRSVNISATNDDPTLAAALNAPSPYLLGAFYQELTFDGRDSQLAPSRGVYLSVGVAEGTAAAGSAIDYLRLDTQARAYVALGRHLVIAGRVRFGGLWPSDAANQPITERFFAGGTDMRGFGFRHLSPQAADSTGQLYPIGGDALFESSIDLRLLAWRFSRDWGLELVGFVDAADVTDTITNLSLSPDRLNWAVGPGLHFLTPIGPVGVDMGFRLNRLDPPNPDPAPLGKAYAIFIQLGEAF
jgi:translocation and assembly module TamA